MSNTTHLIKVCTHGVSRASLCDPPFLLFFPPSEIYTTTDSVRGRVFVSPIVTHTVEQNYSRAIVSDDETSIGKR